MKQIKSYTCNHVPEFLKLITKHVKKHGQNKLLSHIDSLHFMCWILTPTLKFGISADQLISFVYATESVIDSSATGVTSVYTKITQLVQQAIKLGTK